MMLVNAFSRVMRLAMSKNNPYASDANTST